MRNNHIYKRVGISFITIVMLILSLVFCGSVTAYADENDMSDLAGSEDTTNNEIISDDQIITNNDETDSEDETDFNEGLSSENEGDSEEKHDSDVEDDSKSDIGSENQNAISNENDPSDGSTSVTVPQDISPKTDASQDFSTDTSTPSLSGTKDPTPPYSIEATEGGYMLVGGDPDKDATVNWIVEVDGAQYIVEPGTRMILTGFVPVGDETYYALSSTGKIAVDSNKMYMDTDGNYKYVKEGKFTPFTGIVKMHGNSGWFSVKNGIYVPTFTGLAMREDNGKYYYVENGKYKKEVHGIARKIDEASGWFYVKDSKYKPGFTGFAIKPGTENYYFVRESKYDKSFTGLALSAHAKGYYYAENGKYIRTYTGLTGHIDETGWHFAKNGKFNTEFKGLAKKPETNNYYYVENGRYTKGFHGIARKADESSGWFYAKNSKYKPTFTGIAIKPGTQNYYFVKNGQYDSTFTGLAKSAHDGEYYYAKNGKYDKRYTGLTLKIDTTGWHFAKDGKFNTEFKGLARRPETRNYYYVENGRYTKNFTGIVRKADEDGWFLAKNGKFNTFTGLANSSINPNYYYVRKGKIKDYTFFGLAKKIDETGYFFARKGKMDLKYTGPAGNIDDLKVYHVKKGRPTTVTGTVTANGQTYDVKNGLVVKSKVTINNKKINVDSKGNFYIKSGWLDFLGEKFYYVKSKKTTGANLINDRQYYFEKNGILSSRTGIDVSEWQGDIDWEKVKADGIDFVFIRAGGRYWGPTRTSIYTDDYAIRNLQGATKAGLDVGVYFFTQAISVKEALEEAEFTVNMLKGYNISMPVVIDTEPSGYDKRHNTIDKRVRTDVVKAFCEYVEKSGYTGMYYAGISWSRDHLIVSELDNRWDHWVPQYYRECEYDGKYKCWQYSDSGRVNGIYGNCDMNIWYENR